MNLKTIIHTLRNPYLMSDEARREARLEAALLLERAEAVRTFEPGDYCRLKGCCAHKAAGSPTWPDRETNGFNSAEIKITDDDIKSECGHRVHAAILAERAACAQVCDDLWLEDAKAVTAGRAWPKYHDAIECAHAIRQRSGLEPTHDMVTAGYRAADFAEVDVRSIFLAMIGSPDAKEVLLKAGWRPAEAAKEA